MQVSAQEENKKDIQVTKTGHRNSRLEFEKDLIRDLKELLEGLLTIWEGREFQISLLYNLYSSARVTYVPYIYTSPLFTH